MIQTPGTVSYKKLKVAAIRRSTKLYRISLSSYPSPIYFNEGQSGRFNSPSGQYGVCYTADSVDAAFSESLGHSVSQRYAPSHQKVIPESDLMAYHVYEIEVTSTIHVGELYGSGLPRLNLDNSINSSPKPYTIPQEWSEWIHNHPSNLDGIRYQSRHLSDIRCEALFDRASEKLSYLDLGALIDWACPKSGRDICDLLDEQGWSIA